jgi:hypothetical protein
MLTDILAPLIRSNQPQSCPGLSQALLADWYNTVLRLKNEVGQWVNKHSKHTNVGAGVLTSTAFRAVACFDGVHLSFSGF